MYVLGVPLRDQGLTLIRRDKPPGDFCILDLTFLCRWVESGGTWEGASPPGFDSLLVLSPSLRHN
jgi:hypothetical protein